MTSTPLGLGIVGAGVLAQRVIRHLVLDDVRPLLRVTHLCDPVEGRAAAVAADHSVPSASMTLEELLADPAVDLVSIASPVGLHYTQGLQAIAAGKHVHFNKTMALTCDEATTLIDAAAANGVQLVASPGEMLRPHHRRAKELIEEGAIGTLCWAACGAALGSYHEDEPGREGIDPSWYFRVPGGGPLYDMTVYALHAITGVLGSAVRVTAVSGVRIPERRFAGRTITTEAHDNTGILLDFGEGLFAFAHGTAAGILSEDESWDPSGRYFGTAGEIIADRLNGEPFEHDGRDTDSLYGTWSLPLVGAEHRGMLEVHVYADIMELVQLVLDGTPTCVTANHARHVIDIIEAAYRASAEGTTQSLRTTVDGLRRAAA